MLPNEEKLLNKLDKDDKEKLLYFAKILLRQRKYNALKEEIQSRKEEVKKGEILSHKEIWDDLDV